MMGAFNFRVLANESSEGLCEGMTKSGPEFLPYLVASRLSSIFVHYNQVKTTLSIINLDSLLFNSTGRLFRLKFNGQVRGQPLKKVELLCGARGKS
jgi:hypothetical protein